MQHHGSYRDRKNPPTVILSHRGLSLLFISVPEEAIYIMRSSDVKEDELVLSVVVVHAYTKSYMESIYR